MKVKEIKNYCLHGVYLLFHNKSDTLHYLFAIPSAFTLSHKNPSGFYVDPRELELSKNLSKNKKLAYYILIS